MFLIKKPVEWCKRKLGKNVLDGIDTSGLCWYSINNSLVGYAESRPKARVLIIIRNTNPELEPYFYDYTFNTETVVERDSVFYVGYVWNYPSKSVRIKRLFEWVFDYSDFKRREPSLAEARVIAESMSQNRIKMLQIEQSYRNNPEWIALNEKNLALEKNRLGVLYANPRQYKLIQDKFDPKGEM
ncbi:hypothetical protein [Paenibacillus xylanexedens]|uniref:hypothetical protein n=1 Tax=Paenibacillus xylanexedens TaxID=528191 RepID=UPI000F522D79|nr:hypothetical protein [Paenibacillus xylanexedens]